MLEVNAEFLVRKAEQLINEEYNFKDGIQLYKAAAVLYRNNNQLNLSAATLLKIGVILQDQDNFYQEAIEAYQEVAKIHLSENNQESYSNALMSAAFVAQKAENNALAIQLFLKAGKEYQEVAEKYWQDKETVLAWDNIQLSCRCWKNILRISDSSTS